MKTLELVAEFPPVMFLHIDLQSKSLDWDKSNPMGEELFPNREEDPDLGNFLHFSEEEIIRSTLYILGIRCTLAKINSPSHLLVLRNLWQKDKLLPRFTKIYREE